jgi:hypothetical protein
MILRYAELMVGRVVLGEKSIEKPVKLALTYETDIANLHASVPCPWSGLPQGMSARRILDRKLFTKNIVMGHWGLRGPGKALGGYSVMAVISLLTPASILGNFNSHNHAP